MRRKYFLFGVLTIILTIPVITKAQEAPNTISGRVTNFGKPLADVAVLQVGGIYGTETDANGRYEIQAYPRDTLRFSLVGMKTVTILVEDVTRTLNIEMDPRVNELDEVTVTKRRARTNKELRLEYPFNKGIVNSSFGFIDKRRASATIRFIDGDELLPVGKDFLASLELHINFFGRIDRQDTTGYGPKVYTRQGFSSLREPAAIYDVDGMIITYAPLWLSVENIDRIAILTGIGATTAYGLRGSGGVIVINTKGANIAPVSRSASGRPYADDSNIVNSVSVRKSPSGSLPNYMQDLNKASSESEAIATFENMRIDMVLHHISYWMPPVIFGKNGISSPRPTVYLNRSFRILVRIRSC